MFVYTTAKWNMLKGVMDLSSLTLRCLLLKSGDFNPDHDFVSDLDPATNELTTPGYARKTLTNVGVAEDEVNDRATVSSDAIIFPNLAATQHVWAAVIYTRVGPVDDDFFDILVAYYGINLTPNGEDFVLLPDNAEHGDFLRVA